MNTDLIFYILDAMAVLLISISISGFDSGLAVLGVPLMALVDFWLGIWLNKREDQQPFFTLA